MADYLDNIVKSWGPDLKIARVRWVPSNAGTQTLTEAYGVRSVTRSGAGAYTVNLVDSKLKDLEAVVQVVENDTTHYHFARAESFSLANGTVAVSHKSCAYADVATGPAGSDTVDQLKVIVFYRLYD